MEYELYHHGIKGQKWGERRYQRKDGSLTPAGIKRYGTRTNYEKVKAAKRAASPSVMRAKKRREKAEARTQAEIAKYKKKAGLIDESKSITETTTQPKPKTSIAKPKPKSISEMSTDELRERTNRMNAEKDYIEAQNKLSSLQPKQKAKGSEFAKSIANKTLNDVVVPAVLDVGKQAVKSYLVNSINKKFDLNDELKVFTNNKKK